MGARLTELAAKVPAGQAIVDIAPWLGSTSAYLALGIIRAGNINPLYAIDLWVASDDYVKKAAKYNGLTLTPGEDLRDRYLRNMRPFAVKIHTLQGDVREIKSWKGPIGLLVDDISNTEELIRSTMKTFAPALVTGGYLVLMDWGFHEARNFPYQKRFMDRNGGAFKMVERLPEPSKAAIFQRLGGKVVL